MEEVSHNNQPISTEKVTKDKISKRQEQAVTKQQVQQLHNHPQVRSQRFSMCSVNQYKGQNIKEVKNKNKEAEVKRFCCAGSLAKAGLKLWHL